MYPLRKFLNLYAAKEKLEIVSGAAHFDFAQYRPPPFRIFAGGFFRKNAFELIQEYCERSENPSEQTALLAAGN